MFLWFKNSAWDFLGFNFGSGFFFGGGGEGGGVASSWRDFLGVDL